MKVIGFSSLSHDTSITYIENGEIIASYVTERFTRDKYDTASTPRIPLNEIIKDHLENIDTKNLEFSVGLPVHLHDSFLESILELTPRIRVFDHHLCHAASSYYTSGFSEKTLIFSLDATSSTNYFKNWIEKSDLLLRKEQYFKSIYGAIYSGQFGEMTLLEEISGAPDKFDVETYSNAINSLVWIWMRIVEKFGFRNKDEGKIMGLAPQGNFNQELYKRLIQFANFDNDIATLFEPYSRILESEGWFSEEQKRKDFAHTWQRVSEDVVVDFLYKIKKKYPGHKKICLSGGFFANVKVTQRINEYLDFEEVWVVPPMGDDGISLGAALLRSKELGSVRNKRLENAFLGKGWSNNYCFDLVNNLDYKIMPRDSKFISEYLISCKLVGLFIGREEYGPRALGHRTILCDPRKKENHQYINQKLNRNEIMPFAPMIMEEMMSQVCYAYKSLQTAEFMTICYTVKDIWIDKIPAVVQYDDKSCRAQSVNKERNTVCWDILNEFYKQTGVPVLLNTSFNGHGEPIIHTPEQALEKLDNGVVDLLVLNNMMIERR
jgi:carbamoyltransferase